MSPVHSDTHPGLERALDSKSVRGDLEAALARSDPRLRVISLSVVDVRYRAGGACWVLYRLRARDAEGRAHDLWLSARLLDRGESPDPVPDTLAVRYANLPLRVIPEASFLLPEIPMVVYPFPVDASLPGLFDASDSGAMKRHLGRLWSERRVRVRRVRVVPRGYTPHARAAFFYEVLSQDRRTGIPEVRRLVGKMHAKKSTARLFADQWALWAASRGRLPIPPPVGFIGLAGLTLQEQVRGERLGGMVDRPGFEKHVRHTARALSVLHGLRFPISTRRRPADEVETIRRWSGVLTAIRPDLSAPIAGIVERLTRGVLERSTPSAIIHADFHHTNVLVDGSAIHLIDFDEMAWGDPMVDVGRFLASLRVPARRAHGDLSALDGPGHTFLEEYLKRTAGDERRARLYEAAALLISAGSSFRMQRKNWALETGLLVDECERVLRLAERGVPVPAQEAESPDVTELRLTPEEKAAWIRDPVYMHALLEPHLRRTHGVELTGCRVTAPEDPGDAAHVRFHLKGWCGDSGWEGEFLGETGRERGGKPFFDRLKQVAKASENPPDAFLLPKPLMYDRRLSLMVWESIEGQRLTTRIDTPLGEEASRRAAGAMASLHRTPLHFEAAWLWERELAQLQHGIASIARLDPAWMHRAEAILTTLLERIPSSPGPGVPSLRNVHPRHVLLVGDRVALEKVEDVVMAPSGLDAGDFLARLTLFGIASGMGPAAARAHLAFRRAFAQAEPGNDALPAFEAATLLRFAQNRVLRTRGSEAAALLLAAEDRLREAPNAASRGGAP